MRDRIIEEIRKTVATTGKVPGWRAFETETGILSKEWQGKIWARWSDALKEAGFEPNALTKKYNPDQILQYVSDCCQSLNRFPSNSDLRLFAHQNPGGLSDATVHNHYPRRALLIEALREFLKDKPSLNHILEMLPAVSCEKKDLQQHSINGHVYLLKAGDYYKIGQSSDLEKRVKSINVALPNKATLEHAISTDDPPGIESYWHRRFADCRANGEWFKLSKADVMAFKKRKFQ